MTSPPKYSLVCLKSFGDLTIAARALRTLHDDDAGTIGLCLGSHHLDLYHALQPNCVAEVINLKYPGVPAFYDIKNMGLSKATLSLLNASTALSAHKNKTRILIFDVLSWREKFLARGANAIALDNEKNIYKNYNTTFLKLFGRIREEETQPGRGKTILILPHGRKSFRNIPSDLIDQMATLCLKKGFDPLLYLLEGETPITSRIPRVLHAKRSFVHLRDEIERAHAIISADSLAAHLATFVKRPVFIATPYLKTSYWLPPYSLEHQFWGLFSEANKTISSLQRFLNSLSQNHNKETNT